MNDSWEKKKVQKIKLVFERKRNVNSYMCEEGEVIQGAEKESPQPIQIDFSVNLKRMLPINQDAKRPI